MALRDLLIGVGAAVVLVSAASAANAAPVITFGDEDCLGFGCYGASDPTAGATLFGLSPGTVTDATGTYAHSFPFSPSGDFPGTDQIYVGSVQTGFHDGYSVSAQRINGPQVLTLDYSSLVAPGQLVTSITLGIAADDFQNHPFGQPFTALLDGSASQGAALTTKLNSLNETTPLVHFLTIGLDPTLDNLTHKLTLSIDQGGDGGDGWAVDFLTVGVTTAAVPEPATWAMLLFGAGCVGGAMRMARRKTRDLAAA